MLCLIYFAAVNDGLESAVSGMKNSKKPVSVYKCLVLSFSYIYSNLCLDYNDSPYIGFYLMVRLIPAH